MNRSDPTTDENYRRYADLLLQHSNLIAGQQEGIEGVETVEEELERLWEAFDAAQRQSLAGLGSDLGWVRRRFEPAPRGRRPDEVTGEDIRLLIDAKGRSDWHGVLHHLRICSAIIHPFQLAYLRASAWSALDHLRQASFFYDVASDIDPANGPVALLALRTIAQFDRVGAIERAQAVIANPFRHSTLVIVFSLALLLREGVALDEGRVVGLLHRCLDRQRIESPSDAERTMLLQLVASSFEALGEVEPARSSYEEALQLAPDNDALLTGLGMLLYGREDERAAGLFERALAQDSPLVWPAFFLAHFYLVRGEFDRSQPLCLRALQRATSDQVRADLTEWLAICQSEISFDDKAVYDLFQRARSLAPDNARIAHNIEVYEVRKRTAGHDSYKYEPAELLRVHREAEPQQPVTLSAA